ncbi:unnamed protein product [Darwinula stevensoni]|uniref:TLC domain-containing protein n=1 Tax=Darwinula stevensoni TaxID=69355 RepID=A0A7R9A9V7_9CRUS|nr:unnamed protein product [Darwinula stevensoni]CAG0897805.1 unnamed protein product [Darwinula stevensoni]
MADKPWLRDTYLCFTNLPFHPVTLDIWRYYMVELGFYASQLMTLPFDEKRKDYLAQMTHHVVTIGLLVGSWTSGTIRVGSLVLLVHDCADIFLQLAKLLRYFKSPAATFQKVFVVFVVTWILTRLVYFPLYINIPATETARNNPRFSSCFVSKALIFLLWSLFCLHLYWTVLLFRAIYRAVVLKREVEDNRSEDEDSDSDEVDKKSE